MKVATSPHNIKTFKQSTKKHANTTEKPNSIINRSSNVIFSNTLSIVLSDTPSIGVEEIGAISIVHFREGTLVHQLQYNRFTYQQGLNNASRVDSIEWIKTMKKLLPQHPQFHTPRDTCLQNGILNTLNDIINSFYLNGMFEGDKRRFGRDLAAFTLLALGHQAHNKTTISAAYNIDDRVELDKHHANIVYTGQGMLNILL